MVNSSTSVLKNNKAVWINENTVQTTNIDMFTPATRLLVEHAKQLKVKWYIRAVINEITAQLLL